MKRGLLLAAVAVSLLTSCQKVEEKETCLTASIDGTCIEGKIEAFKKEERSLAIYSIVVDCETHFWFRDGSLAWDGTEYIFNTDCEEVCYICGLCMQPACSKDYPVNINEWTKVWEK
jgi:hypothetical protein